MKKERKNFKSKLHLACSNDDLRPVLNYIIFDKNYAVCTDGHILIKQSLEINGFTEEEITKLNGKMIYRETFKEIYKYDDVTIDDDFFICKKEGVQAKFEILNQNGKYPEYQKVIPKLDEKQKIENIGFNFNNLSKIKMLLAGNKSSIRFNFFGKNKAVLIHSEEYGIEKDMVLIMPVHFYE